MLRGLNVLSTQIVYFGRAIPWIIIDAIPYFKKWKLQPVRLLLAVGREPSDDLLTGFLYRTKCQQPRSSGSALNSFYYRISRLNCLVYGFFRSAGRMWTESLPDLDVRPHGGVFWHEDLARTLPSLANNCLASRSFLRSRGRLSLCWCVLELHLHETCPLIAHSQPIKHCTMVPSTVTSTNYIISTQHLSASPPNTLTQRRP